MAEDDIIELTDIVKVGHAQTPNTTSTAPAGLDEAAAGQPAEFSYAATAQFANNAGADSKAQGTMPDFGADLDALLQNYDNVPFPAPVPSGNTAEATASSPDGKVMPAPVANAEVSDHQVDLNEELELPPLSDLDALLEELGVQDNSPKLSASAVSEKPAASPAPEEAEELAKQADFVEPVIKQEAEKAGNLESASVEAPESVLPKPKVPADAELEVPEFSATADESDGIDLNELDALLDSVLASAPKAASAPSAEKASQPASQDIPEAKLAEEDLALPDAPEDEAATVSEEELFVEAATAPAEEKIAAEAAASFEPAVASAPFTAKASDDSEAAVPLEVPSEEASGEPVQGSSALITEVRALQDEVAALKAELADLRDNIDKYAAAAAAKVIREEIAVLAAHLG